LDQINLISQTTSILIILAISILFIAVGILYSKKYQGL